MSIHFEYSEHDKKLAEARALGRTQKTSHGAELIQACISEDTMERFYTRVYLPAETLSKAINKRTYLKGHVMYLHGRTPHEDLQEHGLALPFELIGMGEILSDGLGEFYDIPTPTLVTMCKVISRWVSNHPNGVLLLHTGEETYRELKVNRPTLTVRAPSGAHVRLFYV